MNIKVKDAEITEDVADTLSELQKCENEYLNIYIVFLDKVSEGLFKLGNNMDRSDSKDEIFEMLHKTHLLKKDLNKLKATNINIDPK
jgi:hypothetical protein